MRRKARVDDNQSEIVKALRKIPNVSVAVTSQLGQGYTDITIGFKGVNYLVEIKDGNKPKHQQKLTDDEERFHKSWTGQIAVCSNLDEILELLGCG